MSIKLPSSGGGSITFVPTATSGNYTLNFPSTAGTGSDQIITTGDTNIISENMLETVGKFQSSNELLLQSFANDASVAWVQFIGIPNWAKRLTLTFVGLVPTSSTYGYYSVQMGSSNGWFTTNYESNSSYYNSSGTTAASEAAITNGFYIRPRAGTAQITSGTYTFYRLAAYQPYGGIPGQCWVGHGTFLDEGSTSDNGIGIGMLWTNPFLNGSYIVDRLRILPVTSAGVAGGAFATGDWDLTYE